MDLMALTRRPNAGREMAVTAGLGSAGLLALALFFQWRGAVPCDLCILQRWPHLAAAMIGLAVLGLGARRVLVALGLIAAVVACGLAIYHSGVELHWWAGPTHCSGGVGSLAEISTQDLLARLQEAPVVRCDEVSWRLLGLSMANWNVLASGGLAALWAMALRRAA